MKYKVYANRSMSVQDLEGGIREVIRPIKGCRSDPLAAFVLK